MQERDSIIQTVRRWGGAASAAVLEPSCSYFSVPEIDGLIAYKTSPGCAVVFGDPVCDSSQKETLAKAFHSHCQQQKQKVIYVTASEDFGRWAVNDLKGALIQFGEEILLDPQNDPRSREGVQASLVRRKVRHAQHEGTEVIEYTGGNTILEKQMDEIGSRWVGQRRGPQIYISHVRLFDDRLGKRWFYAQHQGRPVGVVMLHKLESRQGWLLNHLMLAADAPHGTPELLVVTALEALQKEGCRFVTCGAVPADKIGEICGLGVCMTWITRQAFSMVKKIFRMEGRKKFWEKFAPQQAGSFLVFSQPRIGLAEIKALMQTLNASV